MTANQSDNFRDDFEDYISPLKDHKQLKFLRLQWSKKHIYPKPRHARMNTLLFDKKYTCVIVASLELSARCVSFSLEKVEVFSEFLFMLRSLKERFFWGFQYLTNR